MTDISGGYLRTFGTIPGPSDQTDPNNQLGAPTKTMEYKLVNGGTRTNAVVGEIPAGSATSDVVYTATFASFTKATKVLTLSTTPTGTLVNGMTVTGGTPAIIGDVKISNVNTQTNLTLDKEINATSGTISFTTFDRITGRQRWTGSNTFQNSVNFEAGATGLTLDNPWEGPEILDGASYVYTEDATTNVLISGSNGIPPTGGAGWSTSIKLYVDGELGMSTQLSPTFGGTGVSSYTAGDILYATGASTLTKLAIGSASQVLSVNSGATAPEWSSISDFTNDWESATVNTAFSLYPKDDASNDQPNIIFPLDPGSLSNPGPYKFYIEGGSTTVHFDGTLTIGNALATGSGGTGLSSYTAGDLVYYSSGTTLSKIAIGTALQVLAVNGAGNTPEWTSISNIPCVTSINFGTTGLLPNTATTGVVTVTGTLAATSGGTGLNTYTKGDILYSNAANSLAKLAISSTQGDILKVSSTGIPEWGTGTFGVVDKVYRISSTSNYSYQLQISSTNPTTRKAGNWYYVIHPDMYNWTITPKSRYYLCYVQYYSMAYKCTEQQYGQYVWRIAGSQAAADGYTGGGGAAGGLDGGWLGGCKTIHMRPQGEADGNSTSVNTAFSGFTSSFEVIIDLGTDWDDGNSKLIYPQVCTTNTGGNSNSRYCAYICVGARDTGAAPDNWYQPVSSGDWDFIFKLTPIDGNTAGVFNDISSTPKAGNGIHTTNPA